jgi:Asp-tRNA(Asn)/Glu-tRNA(Gln) amidotransferase A subunit family amidase
MTQNPDVQVYLAGGSQLTTVDYLLAQQQRTRSICFLKELFERVDCIITPACPVTAPPIDEKSIEFGESDPYMTGKLMRYAFLGNLTGVPCLTLPVGYDSYGLPIGLQIMSKWWDEKLLFHVALAIERLVEKRKPNVYYSIL